MMETKFSIVERMGVAELEWKAIPMDRVFETFKKSIDLPQNVLYAFEGKYDAYPSTVVLYVGKTEAKKGVRPCDSAYARFYCAPQMSCCYRNMTLRWAIPPTEKSWTIQSQDTLTEVLERLLIHAMKPALNSQGVDGWLPPDPWFRRLIVCNKGDKGLLLPVVYGDYFARKECLSDENL
jgi:hypothetical protein